MTIAGDGPDSETPPARCVHDLCHSSPRMQCDETTIGETTIRLPTLIRHKITERCNLNCVMCEYAIGNKRESASELTTHQVIELYDAIAAEYERFPSRLPTVRITGGEPSVRRDLEAICEYLAGRGFRVVLNTNGTLLRRSSIPRLISSLSLLVVSIDGDPNSHDSVRGRTGAFNQTTQNVQRFAETSDGPPIAINFAIVRDNYLSLPFVVGLAHELGAGLQIQHTFFSTPRILAEHGRDTNRRFGQALSEPTGTIINDPSEFAPTSFRGLAYELDRARLLKLDLGVQLKVIPDLPHDQLGTYYLRPHEYRPSGSCVYPDLSVKITPDGRYSLCCGYHLGDSRGLTLSAAFGGIRRTRFSESLSCSGPLPGCFRCCFFNVRPGTVHTL